MAKTKTKKPGVGERLMDGAVGFGKFQIWIGIVLFGFLSVACLLGGISFFFAEDVLTETGKGVVNEDSQCQYVHSGDSSKLVCDTTVSYQVNGKDYKIPISTNTRHLKGSEVDIEWEVGKPETAMICCRTKNKVIALILFCVSLLFAAGAGFNYYFRNNEAYAAGTAAGFFMR